MTKLQKKFKLDDITEAITFTPNEEEFREPLEYINKIRPLAEKYGICKIVPPKNWKPPFCIDMYNFKFRPRVQCLNELEANSRIKLNFLEKLSKFWELQGKKFKVPILEGKQMDLYKFYKSVEAMGGYECVTKSKRWSQLAKQLNYKDTYTCTTLKSHFENLLYPFLLFEAGVTLPVSASKKRINDIGYSSVGEESNESINQPSNKRQKMSSQSMTNTNKKTGKFKGSSSSSSSSSSQLDEEKIEQIRCLVCERGDDEAFMLLCDGCDDSYHTFCLYPPLKEIPKGDWRCPLCVAEICKKPTDAYGFEQSPTEYNLVDFGKMANEFKNNYFKKSIQSITPEEVEAEFWRILCSEESVKVEYGADLHTIETGSGFPTRSNKGKFKENDQPYVDSPWNLNNLSLLEKSVLSQMNVEISGMKIPWAYVGMCFSCFCWHVEDHWSYSINYLHMGDIKTWYGVSGNDADTFEKVMKQNASELFDKAPDLLHHLVTIMNPVSLKENGVPIYKINQRVGEFVVTFPRAYHAGFNQGFNFAEAVNFCPADWMPLGRAAIESYKQVKRHTVFSHDELVCKLASNKNVLDVNISIAIQNELKLIIDSEKEYRKILLDKGVKNARKLAFEMLTDDERTCDYCKTTCFVSAINCSCSPEKLVCLNHYQHLCEVSTQKSASKNHLTQNQSHRLTVLYRYEMQELYTLYSKLKQQTDSYFKWCDQVESLIGQKDSIKMLKDDDIEIIEYDDKKDPLIESNFKKPHFNELLKLFQEAKDNKYPHKNLFYNKTNLNVLSELEQEINFALNCSKMCKKYLNLFKQNKNDDEVNSSSPSPTDDDIIFVKKTQIIRTRPYLDHLKNLELDIGKLKCEIDESELFKKLVNEAVEYEIKIKNMIDKWNLERPDEIKSVIDYLNRIDIEFPVMLVEQIRLMHKQAVWLERVNNSVQEPSKFTIKIIKDLIDEFTNENLLVSFTNDQKCNETIQKSFVDLQELLSIAQTWDDKAKKQIDLNNKTKLEDLEEILKEAKFIPVQMDNVLKLENIVKEAYKWLHHADSNLKDPAYPYLCDLKEIIKKSQDLPIVFSLTTTIETRITLANEWLIKLEHIFLKTDSASLNLIDVLTPRLDLSYLITKLQNSLSTNSTNSSSPSLSTVLNLSDVNKSQTKRQRTKLFNNSNSKETENSSLNNNIFELPNDFYKDKIINLSEKYKAFQIKELELIKTCRKLNTDKIQLIKSHLQNLTNSSTDLSKSNETSNSKNDNSLNKLKCSTCSSSIVNRILASQFLQCKLCLGLYCSSCKTNSSKASNKIDQPQYSLCSNCERSKRPKLDQVISYLVSFESIELRSQESNALQMYINRVLTWIDKHDKLTTEPDILNLFKLFDKQNCSQSNDLNEMFNKLNPLKTVELQDLYLDGLLMEVETDQMNRLNELFYFINKNNNDFEQILTMTEKLNDTKSSNNVQSTESSPGTTSSLNSKLKSVKQEKTIKNNTKINKISSIEIETIQKTTNKVEKVKKINQTINKSKEKEEQPTTSKARKRDLAHVEDTVEEESCAALKCIKPSGDNIKWVQCDGNCNKWFHMLCVGISKIKRKDKYLCHLCNDNNQDDSSNSSMNSSNSTNQKTQKNASQSSQEESIECNLVTEIKYDCSVEDKLINNNYYNNNTSKHKISTLALELNEASTKLNDTINTSVETID